MCFMLKLKIVKTEMFISRNYETSHKFNDCILQKIFEISLVKMMGSFDNIYHMQKRIRHISGKKMELQHALLVDYNAFLIT